LTKFAERGLLRLPGLIARETVDAALGAVRGSLERLGYWQGGAWRLDAKPRPAWPAPGLHAKDVGNKHSEVAAIIADPALLAVVDDLLEGRPFERKLFDRPGVLATLPNIDAWKLPQGWHLDSPRLPSRQSLGVQLFTFLDRVEPGGGGTLVVAGSHRLLNDGRFRRSGSVTKALKREPFFAELSRGQVAWTPGDPLPRGRADSVEVEVVELTGEPGDAWFTDLRLLHSSAPNAAATPRLMVTHRFWRADLTAEAAEGYGWRTPEADG
jgi:hypothetical protein